MADYVLYGEKRSGSFAIEALLAEAGAKVQVHWLSLDKNEQLTDEYRKLNPLGQIPTLVLPGGTVMTESAAIILELCDRFPNLAPKQATPERARFYRWLVFIPANIYASVSRYDYPERFSTDPAHGEAIRAAAKEMIRKDWLIVEREVNGPFFFGEQFTALDVYIAGISRWIAGKEWRAEHLPKIEALAKQVAARPKIAPVWTGHFGA